MQSLWLESEPHPEERVCVVSMESEPQRENVWSEWSQNPRERMCRHMYTSETNCERVLYSRLLRVKAKAVLRVS